MNSGYNGNTVFYQKANNSTLTLKDIFSDVLKKHDKLDGEKLFIAGTSASTPSPSQMLQEWRKPWLFLRVLAAGLALLFLMYIMIMQGFGLQVTSPFAFFGAAVVPVAVLLFYWEMNIPRNIPIYQVVVMLLAGGCLSLIFTGVFQTFTGAYPVYYAPFTEEPAKLLALCLFLYKPRRNYILNGILIGGAIGAGFAMIETVGYFWQYNFDFNVLILRGVTSPGMHVVWAAMYGGALAMVKGNEKLKLEHFFSMDFLKYFLAAVALHFAWNYYPVMLFTLPIVGDAKYVVLTIAAWLVLLTIIKKGIQQVLAVSINTFPTENAKAVSMPQLYGVSGMYTGQFLPLLGGKIVIGRDSSSCNIIFPGETEGVSRRHCTVSFDGRNVWICDENSSNGTFLDSGEKLQAGRMTLLNRGQKFYLANINTMFELR